jgi:hypothetical protein
MEDTMKDDKKGKIEQRLLIPPYDMV